MSYEIHAYCTSDAPPTIGGLLTWLRDKENGWGLEADAPGEGAKALASPKWKEFELVYGRKGAEKQSLLLGCYRNTGPRSMCARMVRDQQEMIADYKDSPGKRRVVACLASTRFIVWCRVDNDPDRERASPVLDLLASLFEQHGAVFDLEDEGFLADSDTPLCGWCAHDE